MQESLIVPRGPSREASMAPAPVAQGELFLFPVLFAVSAPRQLAHLSLSRGRHRVRGHMRQWPVWACEVSTFPWSYDEKRPSAAGG